MNWQLASSTHQPAAQNSIDHPSPGQRIIVIDAILDEIFSFSTPRTIINISKTCRAARPIAASYFRAAYKPERLLQQFLPDSAAVRAFRTLQAETGLTIFGKAAYDFLARASFSGTDTATTVMSLYVDKSYASLVNDFFTGVGYDVEMREHELVFLKKGEDNLIINEVVLQASHPDSFDSVDKPRNLPIGTCCVGCTSGLGANERLMQTSTELMDVITFDGAYSLFPARYDDDGEFGGESGTTAIKGPSPPHLVKLKPMYRSFSDRSSWVVNFEHQMSVVPPPELAFGTSLPVRDPLYTSSLLVSPPKGRPIKRYGDMQLCGVVLRSRLLRLTHILCCIELSQFVQQFLTRLVIAHPGRSNSQCVSDFVSPLPREV